MRNPKGTVSSFSHLMIHSMFSRDAQTPVVVVCYDSCVTMYEQASVESFILIISADFGSLYVLENRAIHQTVPDHRVKLTPEGWRQV